MVTTKTYGEPGLANRRIGGVPTIHYFDFGPRGRGQVVRLMMEDAGIAYTDVRYNLDEYLREHKVNTIAKMNPMAKVPVIELNGRILTQTPAIIRHWARQLGEYEGETEDERYWADAMCDITIDWRAHFVRAKVSPNRDTAFRTHENDRKHFLQALNTHLSSNDLSKRGSFIIGNKITYADLGLYQILHDEQLTQNGRDGLQAYQRLVKLVDAVEGRENIKNFLRSDRYLNML